MASSVRPARGRPHKGMAATQVVDFAPAQPVGDDQVGSVTLLTAPHPGATYPIEGGELVVGRSSDASLHIDDAGLSRKHARIYRQGNQYYVEDLGSTNGTVVDGNAVTAPVPLTDGTRVLVGKRTVLRFAMQDRLELDAARNLYERTVRDGLTGLHNRRYLEDRLQTEFAYAQRHQSPLCLLMVDADYFKRINDTYGHPGGDAVLKVLGGMLDDVTRMEDIAARYGGEEFVLMARAVGMQGGTALAERYRQAVAARRIPFAGHSLSVTVSIGVASTDTGGPYPNAAALLAAADTALYRAKSEGRNRVAATPIR